MLVSDVFVLLLAISCFCTVLGEPFNVGFLIEHASLVHVNGIYMCSSDSRCSSVTSSNDLTLASSHAFVNGEVQKRWFISALTNTISTNLYGAIELTNTPEIKLKTWKRLGTDAAFEPEMTLTPIPTYPSTVTNTTEINVEHLLISANVLIAAYQHNALDRKSDRGRYIYSTLLQYHSLLQNANYKDRLLVHLFECDYMVALGGHSRAGDCYDEVIAQLAVQTGSMDSDHTGSITTISSNISKDYSALQCMQAREAASTNNEHQYSIEFMFCHQHHAQLRQLRHALLQQLNPSRALQIVTQNKQLLPVDVCKVWTLLTLCMVGHCHNGQVFYSAESSLLSIQTTVSFHNTTLSLDVSVSTIATECDVLLAYLHAHGDNEVVHTLFTKLCFLFRRVHNHPAAIDAHQSKLFDSMRSYTDHSRSVINSLLSIGAMEVAASHTVLFTQHMLGTNNYNTLDHGVLSSELALLNLAYPAIGGLLYEDLNRHTSKGILLESSNVRSALALSALLRTILSNNNYKQAFAHNSDLLSNFISMLFHATSPVILSLPPVVTSIYAQTKNDISLDYIWLREALLLRTVLINGLRQLNTLCDSLCSNCCTIVDPTSNIGGRGLFLLAYQGLGLTQESVRKLQYHLCDKYFPSVESTVFSAFCSDTGVNSSVEYIISDKSVPELYAQLIQRTSTRKIEDFVYASPTIIPGEDSSTTQSTYSIAPTTAINERIKVGFVSFFFRRHPVGRLLSKIITHLDPSEFDVYLIVQQDLHRQEEHSMSKHDPITEYLHSNIPKDHILRIPRDESSALATLRAENFDVIVYVDVFMDAFIAHLAMYRIGKVQVAFWGHPFTSGYDSIDYFITSDQFESQRDKFRFQHYQEQLVMFDSLSFQLLLERPSTIETTTHQHIAVGTTYNALPAYLPRSVNNIWSNTNTVSTTGNTSSIFYDRRRDVVTWITSIGYDVYDMPIDDVALCKALLQHGTPSTNDICSVNSSSIEKDDTTGSIGAIIEHLHLYGALQSLFKMHPMFDLAIYHILLRDPYAIILLSRNGKQSVWEESLRTRLVTAITTLWENDKTQNISAESKLQTTLQALLSRVVFVNQMQHIQYEQLVCSMDITLDTFPFGGGVTLSDGLGGCGAHMRNTIAKSIGGQLNTSTSMKSDETAHDHCISSIVPFVTSGQLQSVHQIGAGIAAKLGPNMSNYARSVANREPSLNADTARAEFHRDMYTTHMHYIHEYATAAVATATASHASKMYVQNECEKTRKKQAAEAKIHELLYESTEAAQEWSDFLRRIVMK